MLKSEFLAMLNLTLPIMCKKIKEMITQTNIKRKQKTKQEVPLSENDFTTKLSAHLEWRAL